MIHIIGVSHRVQAKPKGEVDTTDQTTYRQVLVAAIKQIKPVLVGEEYSETAVAKKGSETKREHESITKEVANSLNVEHRYCDPDPSERTKMGYVEGHALVMKYAWEDDPDYNARAYAEEMVKYWPRRERFWAEKLKEAQDRDVVFVCGDAHVESFRKVLDKNHMSSTVHSRRIGINQADDDSLSGIQAYIEAHPELRP